MSGFPAYLYLENGELYSGIGFGIKKHETAEVVFNTALSGYQEIITDPSYAKQIITFTNPHIGNTGINEEDNEASSIYASGIVIRSLTEIPSSWRSTTSLQDFLIKNNSIGISGIDTRKLVNTLRETGSQRAIIAANDSLDPKDAKKELEKFSGLGGLDLAKVVSTKDSYTWDEGVWPDFKKTSSDFHIVAIDFGIKENILRLLAEHVGKITVVNAQTPIEEILNLKPDGIFLSLSLIHI